MRNEPWVWPEVGDAGTSGAGAVPLRSAQMMGKQHTKKKRKKRNETGRQEEERKREGSKTAKSKHIKRTIKIK